MISGDKIIFFYFSQIITDEGTDFHGNIIPQVLCANL